MLKITFYILGPAQSGILTDRECVSLFLHFTVNPKPPVGFLDVPRYNFILFSTQVTELTYLCTICILSGVL